MIPEYVSDKLEAVQKQAAKIIWGWNIDYNDLVNRGIIETLKSRREENSLRFAIKAANSPRFGHIWFKKSPALGTELRPGTRNLYTEQICRTERMCRNPITYMTRQLNKHYRENLTADEQSQ